MEFAGQNAIVTGAGGGIGFEIARDLLLAGANVAMLDLKPEPAGIPDGPGRSLYLSCDVSDDDAVQAAVAAADAEFGGLQLLANVAGVLWFDRDRSALDIDLGLWDQVFSINLKSMVHMVRHSVPLMKRAGGGAMVHFSTIQCLRGDDAPQDAYQASKAGVVALSKSLAIQLASDRIRSNVIFPGPVHSPMQARWDNKPEAIESLAGIIPLGRIGAPKDLANACLFLLSDKADFITGTELTVDGGLMARP